MVPPTKISILKLSMICIFHSAILVSHINFRYIKLAPKLDLTNVQEYMFCCSLPYKNNRFVKLFFLKLIPGFSNVFVDLL